MQEFSQQLAGLNPFTVLVSAAMQIVIGMLWTSPFLFGKAWIRLSGIRPGDIRPEELRRLRVYGLVVALITAALIGLIANHGDHSAPMLFACMLVIWLFIMLQQFMGFAWRREPFAFFLLVTLRSLAMLMGGAAVFYLWS